MFGRSMTWCVCWRRELAHLLDPAALDDDDGILLELVGLAVEQRTATDVHRARCRRSRESYQPRSIVDEVKSSIQ